MYVKLYIIEWHQQHQQLYRPQFLHIFGSEGFVLAMIGIIIIVPISWSSMSSDWLICPSIYFYPYSCCCFVMLGTSSNYYVLCILPICHHNTRYCTLFRLSVATIMGTIQCIQRSYLAPSFVCSFVGQRLNYIVNGGLLRLIIPMHNNNNCAGWRPSTLQLRLSCCGDAAAAAAGWTPEESVCWICDVDVVNDDDEREECCVKLPPSEWFLLHYILLLILLLLLHL